MNDSLTSFLANLTSAPGVYRMLDAEGKVLYVGKAANLKKRVNSYFTKQQTAPKTQSLVKQIVAIEVTITRSETEALLLESNLIKSLRPKYNVLMRDDKTYPFIHVSRAHPYPRLEMMRCKKKPQKGEFYGPYPSVTAIRETFGFIQKTFKIRNCSDNYFNSRTRPCLQYQIKRCSAPCIQATSKVDYHQSLEGAIGFLQGKSQQILADLEQRMQQAVNRLAFEDAAQLRDQIKNLRLMQEQQAMVQLRGDADAIVIDVKPGFACVQCVTIRNGEILSSQSFFPAVPKHHLSADDETEAALWQQVMLAFISYYYLEMPERIPPLIIIDQAVADHSALETMLGELRKKPCQIKVKPRGVRARWLDFAHNNLTLAIAEHKLSTSMMQMRYRALLDLLQLPYPIKRMECFDISHTQGEETVASCVVFDEQGPCKREYRRFNISGITPGDDYAAMEQALTRRYKRLIKAQNFPDLLIIDGGKGQVNIAQQVLDTLGVKTVMILGIAKGPGRKAGWERLILADTKQELTLPMDSEALHLLQHIRDEAHRFAISSHRKKRQKASFVSTLESIPGIGSKRRQALLHRFGGLRELAKAPVEEIAKVRGISQELASQIYHHFHQV